MNRMFKGIFVAIFALMLNATVFAADAGTANDAKAMVKKAVIYLKENGKEKTLAEASNPSGQFVKGDIYLSIYDPAGKVLAHGTNPKLIGKDVSNLKDVDDKFFIKEILATAKKDGKGWEDYKWTNPDTKEIQAKSVYFEQVNDLIIASGFYKK
ncbi:MAG TPA: cache domain-containing protein [Burkholderiaceae bacterium]|jgi:cytochrome c|nr:cache domain-containing protein [Burkholderiaceae bacterium]